VSLLLSVLGLTFVILLDRPDGLSAPTVSAAGSQGAVTPTALSTWRLGNLDVQTFVSTPDLLMLTALRWCGDV